LWGQGLHFSLGDPFFSRSAVNTGMDTVDTGTDDLVRIEVRLHRKTAERLERLARAESRTIAGQLRHLVLTALSTDARHHRRERDMHGNLSLTSWPGLSPEELDDA
jgi:hypothetical protein